MKTKMVKVDISEDEWYPVLFLDSTWNEVWVEEGDQEFFEEVFLEGNYEISEDLLSRYVQVMKEFEEVQDELRKAQQEVHQKRAAELKAMREEAYKKAQEKLNERVREM